MLQYYIYATLPG